MSGELRDVGVEMNLSPSAPEPMSVADSMSSLRLTPAEPDWALTAPDGELIAEVWWCGDDYCDCTQARIVHVVRNRHGGRYESTALWHGTYATEGDWDTPPTTELNREARRLRKHHHDLYRRISWPWDRNKERA
jgi:hypothetical protein